MAYLFKFSGVAVACCVAASASAGGVVYADQEAVVYPYSSAQNYCPEGLQPVSVTGVVSCGRPTAEAPSYQRVKTHPVRRHAKPAADCPIGEKGCH